MELPAQIHSAPAINAPAVIKKADIGVRSPLIALTFIPNIEDAKLIGRKTNASTVTIGYISTISDL